ncbi:hypothetical protein [Brachyspira murdochii]
MIDKLLLEIINLFGAWSLELGAWSLELGAWSLLYFIKIKLFI